MKLGRNNNTIQSIGDVSVPAEYYNRIFTGVYSLDFMFGGANNPGLVKGSTVAITGSPGGGKSTLLTQMCSSAAKRMGLRVLYNSNEETEIQIKMRTDRLGCSGFLVSGFKNVEDLMKACKDNKIDILIQDSLPTLEIGDNDKIKDVCEYVVEQTSCNKMITFVICHVTKSGSMAGPKTIEHAVDAYYHMSVKKNDNRIIKAHKNRMGPASNEFEFRMTNKGFDLNPVKIV